MMALITIILSATALVIGLYAAFKLYMYFRYLEDQKDWEEINSIREDRHRELMHDDQDNDLDQ